MDIRIDEPGVGEWVMDRVTGVFTPGWDHSFSSHRDGEILGGFVVCKYLGASATMHMAGLDPGWCSRELLWLAFDYSFNQLGLGKLIAPVRSDNYYGLSIDLRAGWRVEGLIRDVYPGATHMFILTMTKDSCPWLDYKPRQWRSLDNYSSSDMLQETSDGR
jgi:hypothetical protein